MRSIGFVNLSLVGFILLTLLLLIVVNPSPQPLVCIQRPEQKEIPKSPFTESEEFFQEIGEGMFALHWIPPQMQLPDLRNFLIFYGKNLRPDTLNGKGRFHLALKGSEERMVVQEGEKIYLVYQGGSNTRARKNSEPSREVNGVKKAVVPIWGEVSNAKAVENLKCHYAFSPGNQATPLWFEAKSLSEQTLEIKVSMLDEKGILVISPHEFQHFQIGSQEFAKSQIGGWDLGAHRVDSTLLIRQKARWVGSDMFLSLHGGDEFGHAQNKERIDFFEGEELYSCFICVGDFLIWQNERWRAPRNDEETDRYPLMIVKRIEEKMMTFELWDAEGRGKITLNLIRARDQNGKLNFAQEMKFVGAKTWAQFIVECRTGERITLRLHDWLILTQEGWKKLDTPDQIDAYVNQKLIGPLFILDKMTKKNGKQVLIGHLFNANRTEVEQVELASSSHTSLANMYRHIPMAPPQIQIKTAEKHLNGGEE